MSKQRRYLSLREVHDEIFMDDDSEYEPESGDSSDESDRNDMDLDQNTPPDPQPST